MTKKERKNLKKMGFTDEEVKQFDTTAWKQHCAMQKKQFGFSEQECLKRELEWKKLINKCEKRGQSVSFTDVGNGLQVVSIK